MIKVSELYNDLVIDSANKDENGDISYTKFNRWLWRAQLKVLSWLTGNFDPSKPSPEQISTQKSRDLLSQFIKKYPAQVYNGVIERPSDYYLFRDLYKIKGTNIECADEYEEDELKISKVPIELLDNSKFTTRSNTSIKRLNPSVKHIAKLTENGDFEFEPNDIGSVVLEYYRYPAKAAIVTKVDQVFNDEVPDEDLTTNLEWAEGARQYLLFYLSEMFSIEVREVQFQQQNEAAKE